jgi:hypothetical protein
MKIRIVKAFQAYKRGQEFDWPDGVARIFAARGFVEEVETATADEPEQVERATQEYKPKKKRPRQ